MIKLLKKYQIRTSPFNAAKDWALSNTNNDDLWLMEDRPDEVPVALEFLDYGDGSDYPHENYSCDIALEQQSDDRAVVREGEKTTGPFYPDLEPTNPDGTYKRSIFAQVQTMFYNKYNNPTEMWGMEKIDFPLSQTRKLLTNKFRLISIPKVVYGDKIVPQSVVIADESLDNLYIITDDGNGNLFAERNLFSKFQTVGEYSNSFDTGSSYFCDDYWFHATPITASATESMAEVSFGFFTGSLEIHPLSESAPMMFAFYTGSQEDLPPLSESAATLYSFLFGSVTTEPPMNVVAFPFYSFGSGSVFDTVITGAVTESVATVISYASTGGFIFDTVLTASETQSYINDATGSALYSFGGGVLFDTIVTESVTQSYLESTGSSLYSFYTGSQILVAITMSQQLDRIGENTIAFYTGSLYDLTVSFTGTPLAGPAPLSVTFTYDGAPVFTSYVVGYGDGTFGTGDGAHVYSTPGSYNVGWTGYLSTHTPPYSNSITYSNYVVVS